MLSKSNLLKASVELANARPTGETSGGHDSDFSFPSYVACHDKHKSGHEEFTAIMSSKGVNALMPSTYHVSILLLFALLSVTHAAEGSQPRHASSFMQAALDWKDKPYRVGQAEQCMNWTREVLVQACGAKFAMLETKTPWDLHLLGPKDALLPENVDSLADERFGQRIEQIADLNPGDIVFLKNTYGDWKPGVLTHVGIATGGGNYIHRMTSNQGIVRVQPIPPTELCRRHQSGSFRVPDH